MYYQDEFMKGFKQEMDFHEHLAEIEERGEWIRVPSKSLKVVTVSGHQEEFDQNEKAALNDTISHTGLLLSIPGKLYQLGTTALPSLKGRARVEGKALSEVELPVLANILNECLHVAKGDALIRISEGKVRGVLSGDDTDYAVISMPDLYMVVSAYLHGDFQKTKFLEGYTDHTITTSIWQVEDKRLTSAYESLMKQYKQNLSGVLKGLICVTSSDVGSSGANVFYSLMEGERRVILGEALKVQHKHKKGLKDFTENVETIFDYYKESLKSVTRLCNIHIHYPANTMAGIMAKKKFAKKLIAETVERFKAASGNQPCTAYEIYCGISEALFLAERAGASRPGLLQMEEHIAGCLKVRWHDFDIPGEIRY